MFISSALLSALTISSAVRAAPVINGARDVGNFNTLVSRGQGILLDQRSNIAVARALNQIQAFAERDDGTSGTFKGLVGVMNVVKCFVQTEENNAADKCDSLGLSDDSTSVTAVREKIASLLSDLSDKIKAGEVSDSGDDDGDDGDDGEGSESSSSTEDGDASTSTTATQTDSSTSSTSASTPPITQDGNIVTLGNRRRQHRRMNQQRRDASDTLNSLEEFQELIGSLMNDLMSGTDTPSTISESGPSPTATSTKTAVVTVTATSTRQACPAATAENLGQYIPGCPGYGRRDLARLQARSKADKEIKAILPALAVIVDALPSLLSEAAKSHKDTADSDLTGNITQLANSTSYKKVMKKLAHIVDEISSHSESKTATEASSSSTIAPTTTGAASATLTANAQSVSVAMPTTTNEANSFAKASSSTVDGVDGALSLLTQTHSSASSQQSVDASQVNHGSSGSANRKRAARDPSVLKAASQVLKSTDGLKLTRQQSVDAALISHQHSMSPNATTAAKRSNVDDLLAADGFDFAKRTTITESDMTDLIDDLLNGKRSTVDDGSLSKRDVDIPALKAKLVSLLESKRGEYGSENVDRVVARLVEA